MNYSPEIYSKADDILNTRRQIARHNASKRREELYAKLPELAELDRRQTLAGIEAAKSMLTSQNAAESAQKLEAITAEITARRNEIYRQNGIESDYLKVKHYCPLCGDTGKTADGMCECMRLELTKAACKSFNALTPLSLCGFEDFDLTLYPTAPDPKTGVVPAAKIGEIFDFCKKYAEGFGEGSMSVLMMGQTGLGKTHLSLAIAKEVIKKGFAVVYNTAQNMFNAIEKEHFNKSLDGNYLDTLLTCDLLIIDDLGSEFQTSFTASELYNIINTRLLTAKPVIISTNFTFEDLQKQYSEKIVSRISGNYAFLRFFGNDIRQILRAKR